jgi:hypothetical protein
MATLESLDTSLPGHRRNLRARRNLYPPNESHSGRLTGTAATGDTAQHGTAIGLDWDRLLVLWLGQPRAAAFHPHRPVPVSPEQGDRPYRPTQCGRRLVL